MAFIEFTQTVCEEPEILAYTIARSNTPAEVMDLILALDLEVSDLDFTKELYHKLGDAITAEEEDQ